MSLMFRQKTVIDAGPVTGITMTKDFTSNDMTTITGSDESVQARIALGPAGMLSVGMNSLDVSQCVVFKFTEDTRVYFINDEGNTLPALNCPKNRLSVFHVKLRGLTIENATLTPLEGILYLIGD